VDIRRAPEENRRDSPVEEALDDIQAEAATTPPR